MTYRLVLLGPPGSGKGTQGGILSQSLNIPTISTGALFRDQIARGNALGVEAQTYMAQGHLVPDRVTNAMVDVRMDGADVARGFILDGYPRNVDQVAVLDGMLERRSLELDFALNLDLPEELIVDRLLKRALIEGRADDTEPVIRERLTIYRRETEPIARIYQERGALLEVDALGSVEEVTARMNQAITSRAGGSPSA